MFKPKRFYVDSSILNNFLLKKKNEVIRFFFPLVLQKKYGGHGYTHILENVVPKMRQRGFNNDTINKILCDNPRTWLTFTA